MSDLFTSRCRLLGLGLVSLSFALAACTPKASTDAAPALAALDGSESALPPLPEAQPMLTGPAAPLRLAPAATALPRVRTITYARAPDNDRYAWIDRANRMNETIGDAPPDYGFDYQDGVQPYGWESAGGYRTYAEPVDGGYRTYYYDPGANEPYLVRDPNYSYGYSDGRLATVYDRGGRVLDERQAQQQADYAARYYDRGRSMRAAATNRERRGVAATRWADQREVITRQRAEWKQTQASTPEWRDYRNNHAEPDQQLIDERSARAQASRQFSTWQAQGFRGQTPVLYDQPQGQRRQDQRQQDQRQAQQQAMQLQQVRQTQQAQQARQQQIVQQQSAQQQVVRQREVLARQQAAGQRRAGQARAQQQQRLATEAERQRVARANKDAARQQRLAAGAERLRAARERDVAAKQLAVQQRAAVARQREIDTAKRVAVPRQKSADVALARKAAAEKAARERAARPKAVTP